MRPILQGLSLLALAATLLPAVLYFTGSLELDAVKRWMLVATVAWFAITPSWMGRTESHS